MAIIGEKLNKKLIVYFIFYQTNKIDLLYRALDFHQEKPAKVQRWQALEQLNLG